MKAFLMFPDRDFDPDIELVRALVHFHRHNDPPFDAWRALPWQAPVLFRDLQLDLIFGAMAADDGFLYEVARRAVLQSAGQEIAVTRFRQEILRDCMANPAIIRDLYALSIEAVEAPRKALGWLTRLSPSGTSSGAVTTMRLYMRSLRRLRMIADTNGGGFQSAGFRRFFSMLQEELDDEYFAEVEGHLDRLRFARGVPVSVEIGRGLKGRNYVLLSPADDDSWWAKLFGPREESYTLKIAPRDQAGARALGELRERALVLVADAMRRAADHIQSFFEMIRTELAFYVGCLNLHDALAAMGKPVCIPDVVDPSRRALACAGLFDVALALQKNGKVVGQTLDCGEAGLIVVTGANGGGKSTFLRSLGQAQLMMQAGMFVGAAAFKANAVSGVFTHFKKKEDRTMASGKLDEELVRMSDIVDHLSPDGLVLFNESFASTNEREGSEIARQVTEALEERRVKMAHVTHLFTFASALERRPASRYFLRADPGSNGELTFLLHPGEPRSTSHGMEIYRRHFKDDERTSQAPMDAATIAAL